MTSRFLLACLLTLSLTPVATADEPKAAGKAAVKPIRALLVTGGCCHDYERQKKILSEGISARARVEWVVVHEGGTATNSKIPLYEKDDWAKGFDIVVHNECFAEIPDPEWTQRVLKPHKAGLPAVVIHCAMHCYRDKTDEWFKFLGVTSHGHGAHYPYEVVNAAADNPVMKGFGPRWQTPKGELYQIAKVWPTAKVLAFAASRETKKNEPVVWTNEYEKTRVFGTTVGHYPDEMEDPVYLNYVTRGLLWACDKLNDDYLLDPGTPRVIKEKENLALKKAATASSSQEGHPPEHAVDGDSETRWCPPNGDGGHRWQVDLGGPETVTGCKIHWEGSGQHYRYKVEGSADGQNWNVLSDQSKGEKTEGVHDLAFKADGVRHIRLDYLGNKPSNWGSFWEFEVYGTKTVERTITQDELVKPRPAGEGLLADVKVPPFFSASVYAAPPEVNYPTCLAVSPEGDVYVGVDLNGSLGQGKRQGKILRCRDKDGDGKADEFVTFAELDSPRGMVWDDGTLYVQHPPFVTAFHDRDGDGKSESSTVLVKGIGFDLGFRGADHTTNGMQIGIDGWLYIAVGDYGFTDAVGTDGKHLQLHGGGVVRLRPDGSGLEIVSRGQRNIYDVAIDPRMNLFTRDNTNDGGGWNVRLSHVVPGGQYGYPSLFINFPDEIVEPLADYGGGSPCGSLFVEDGRFPALLGNTLYTCDWGRNVVYRHPLATSGAGFKAEQSAFVEIPRPTDMEIDAHGRIYIASWKDGGFSFSKPQVGYVVQLTPRLDEPSPKLLDLKSATPESLVGELAQPNAIRRLRAQRELIRRGPNGATLAALATLAGEAKNDSVRAAALYTLGLVGREAAIPMLVKAAEDAAQREFALASLSEIPAKEGAIPTEPFTTGLQDSNPRVRLRALFALGHLDRKAAAPFMVPLVADEDPLVKHVAVESLVRLGAADACLKGLESQSADIVRGCLKVLQHLHEPAVVSGIVAKLKTDGELAGPYLAALCRLHDREAEWDGKWWGTRPDTRGPYFKSAAWAETDRIHGVLRASLLSASGATLKTLLADLSKHRIVIPEAQSKLIELARGDAKFHREAVGLLAAQPDPTADVLAYLESVARSEKEDWATRALAIRGLQKNLDQARSLVALVKVFAGVVPPDVLPNDMRVLWDEFLRDTRFANHVPALVGMIPESNLAEREIVDCVLVTIVENPRLPQGARDEATKAINRAWANAEGTVALLRAIGRVEGESLALQVRTQLAAEDPAVKAAARYAADRLGLDRPVDPNEPLVGTLAYEQVLKQAAAPGGDVKLGQRMFNRAGCVACHTTTPQETLKGPLLSGIAQRYKREELIESILKPSAKIAQGFETQFFVMDDGRVFEGFVTREAGDELELRNISGTATILKKSEIEERGRREISVMPTELMGKATVKELSALLAYLESLKQN